MKGTIVSDLDWKTHTVLFLWGLKKFACLDEKRFALLTYVQYSCSCTQICTCSNQKIHNSVKHTVCTQPVTWTNTDTWTCLMCASDSFSVLRNLRFQALLVYWPPSKAPPLSTSAALLLFLLSAYNTQTSSGHWPSLCVCVWRPIRTACCVVADRFAQRERSWPLRLWMRHVNVEHITEVWWVLKRFEVVR